MKSFTLRILFLSILSAAGLVGSLWTFRKNLTPVTPVDNSPSSKCLRNNSASDLHGEKTMKVYEGSRLFQEYLRIPANFSETATSNHSIACEKWAVVTNSFEHDEPIPELVRRLHTSKPNKSWCLALILSLENTKKIKRQGMTHDDALHILAPDQMAGGGNRAFVDFVRAMQASPNPQAAYKNTGYLYALQQGARYILDLEMAPDTKELWASVEETYFASDDVIAVDVPLVGNARAVNPHAYIFNETSLGSSWPRGFPKLHDHPRQHTKGALTKSVPRTRIGVVQQLSRLPDLDAQGFLMMEDVPTKEQRHPLRKKNPFLVPSHAFVPYNAKATLHTTETLWATLLPPSLDSRINDVWRSAMAQVLFDTMQLQVMVVPPPSQPAKIDQLLKSDTNTADTIKTDTMHYAHGRALLHNLEEYRRTISDKDSLPKRMEDLWIYLYEQGFLDLHDVTTMQLWLKALTEKNMYSFPKAQRKPYFQNVVLMGQFNFATYPKHIPANLAQRTAQELARRSEDIRVAPRKSNSNQVDLVIQEDAVELTAFWVQKWREVFQRVVVRGPFSRQQVQDLRLLYGIDAHGMDDTRWKHTINDDGYYAPIANLVQTLEDYKTHSNIDGVIYVHDDMFLDVNDIIQAQSADGVSLATFPKDNILASSQTTRDSYFDPRERIDDDSVSSRTYTIDSRGRFAKLNGQQFGNDPTALMASLEYWLWNPEHCIPRMAELAQDPRVEPFREVEGDHAGSILIPPWEPSDFLFVPMRYADMFMQVASLFVEHRVFLECALPTIVDMLRQKAGATVQTRDLCTSWDEGSRNTGAMITACQESSEGSQDGTTSGAKRHYGLYHPYKLSNGLEEWDAMFDMITLAGFRVGSASG